MTWTGDWELNNTEVSSDINAETLFFTDGTRILNMGFFPSGFDLEEVRDVVLDGVAQGSSSTLQVVDSGSYDNVAYELDTADINGVRFGIWVVVIDRGAASDMTVMIYGAPLPEFSAGMKQAQADITVDGEGVFKGIDPVGLQELLDQSAGSTTSGRASSSGSSSSTSATSGQSSGQSFTSRTWNYTVEYAGPWMNGQGTVDLGEFALFTSSPVAIVSFEGLDAAGIEPVLAFSALSEVFQDNLPFGSTMVGQAVGQDRMIFAANTAEGLFIQEIIFFSGSAVMITMIAEDGDASVQSLQSSVRINGQPVLSLWDIL